MLNYGVQGYLWGRDVSPLLSAIREADDAADLFDVIILSDLIFNHSQHAEMLKTCKDSLEPTKGVIYCAFSHHRPWMEKQDLAFFSMAQEERFGFKVEKVGEEKMPVMFEKDPGDADVRATVHFYTMKLS
jgi:nicotinamide N-methyltransferase